MKDYGRFIEKVGEWLFWIALSIAGYWLVAEADALHPFVVFFALVGLALGLICGMLREYADDDTRQVSEKNVNWASS